MSSLVQKQSIYTDKLYQCIDDDNIDGFVYYFDEWHLVTSILCNNSIDGYKTQLDDEILQFAKDNCKQKYDIYYD
jgi:hypothetical protein